MSFRRVGFRQILASLTTAPAGRLGPGRQITRCSRLGGPMAWAYLLFTGATSDI